ncbi:MAG TPA: hypothetical protein PLV03_02245, partial [Clostridiales bacterium]|nr:hypothetical protein [Clostridiales bacterium]
NMTDFMTLKNNTLAFLENCCPSNGVFNAVGWESSGENSVLTPAARAFIKTDDQIRVLKKSFSQRMAENDWRFSSTPGGCESLEGGHSALETYYFYGLTEQLPQENKDAWIAYFNQYQDRETGYYLGPYVRPKNHRAWRDFSLCTHPWYHMHDHFVSSLCPTMMLLGGKSKYPLSSGSMTGRFLEQSYLEEYLWRRDWNAYQKDGNYRRHNPWWMGNEFWYPACILWQITQWESGTPTAAQARKMLDEVWYKWHDENFGVTGFWYGELNGDPKRIWNNGFSGNILPNDRSDLKFEWVSVPVMGGAHQLWFYDYDGHPIPENVRKAQTDTLLSLQNVNDHRFGLDSPDRLDSESDNCKDVDCMTLLAINYQRQDYRRKEIETALEKAAIAILNDKINKDGVLVSRQNREYLHHSASYETLSRAGDANILDQSFYLWALRAAFSVLKKSDSPALQSFIDYDWPAVPSHWLWLPPRTH